MRQRIVCSLLIFSMFVCIPTSTISQTVTWEQKSVGPDGIQHMAFRSPTEMFVARFNEVHRSTDGGSTWQRLTNQFEGNISSLRVAPNGDILVGSEGSSTVERTGRGIFRSTDDGQTWNRIEGAPIADVVAVDNAGNLYAGNELGFYRSTDNGVHWKKSFRRLHYGYVLPNVFDIIFDSSGHTWYCTLDGLFRSDNHGRSWKTMRFPQPFSSTPHPPINRSLYSLPTKTVGFDAAGNLIAHVLEDYLYRSTNFGKTWTQLQLQYLLPDGTFRGSTIGSLVVTSGGLLYITTGQGVKVSTDQGQTWLVQESGLPAQNLVSFSLVLDPNGYLVMAALEGPNAGVYKSQSPVGSAYPRTTVTDIEVLTARRFALSQNYPNPFNPTTTIEFNLPKNALVTLKVYNTLGQEVATLIHNEVMDEGNQEVEFDASTLSSGVYYYKIVAEDVDASSILFSNTKKMLLMK
ncbi:MAG: T9SS type A sorting domain-containing protein [Ignavibacteriae bacterium]|nr:T9SS type A sorting domain-containing protein [Ignavibacteria bacterium]MBI3364402.1 T9SS type A sorting domain-containing protein [Ignavibacteriota bacterium]